MRELIGPPPLGERRVSGMARRGGQRKQQGGSPFGKKKGRMSRTANADAFTEDLDDDIDKCKLIISIWSFS